MTLLTTCATQPNRLNSKQDPVPERAKQLQKIDVPLFPNKVIPLQPTNWANFSGTRKPRDKNCITNPQISCITSWNPQQWINAFAYINTNNPSVNSIFAAWFSSEHELEAKFLNPINIKEVKNAITKRQWQIIKMRQRVIYTTRTPCRCLKKREKTQMLLNTTLGTDFPVNRQKIAARFESFKLDNALKIALWLTIKSPESWINWKKKKPSIQ